MNKEKLQVMQNEISCSIFEEVIGLDESCRERDKLEVMYGSIMRLARLDAYMSTVFIV